MSKKNETPVKEKTPQVIVISGNDFIGREKARENSIRSLYSRFPDATEERYDASREPFEAFIERMLTPSLFQNTRIFFVKHAQDFSDAELQRLAVVVSAELADVYVCIEFEEGESKKNKSRKVSELLALPAKIKKDPEKFAHLHFDKPPDYKLAEWLTVQVPLLFNRRITRDAAESIIDLAGTELDKVYSELQKIDINLPDKAPVDKEAVGTVIAATRAMNAFELARALSQKDLPRALDIIDSLFQNDFYAPAAVSAIFKQFWSLFKVRAFATENREKANAYFKARYEEKSRIALEIGIRCGLLQASDTVKKAYPVMILSGVIDQAVKYKDEHLCRIFTWLREYDVGIKTGMVKPAREPFQLLCYKIARVEQLQKKEHAA